MQQFFRNDKRNILWVLFGLAALALTVRNLALPADETMTHFNNYVIFKYSFFHLIQGQDLYAAYPGEHYDLYKYSPSFALAMGLIAWMPDWLGLAVWNLINVFFLVFAIKKLPSLQRNTQLLFGILILQETITATINSQSNVLIAALLLLAWVSLEEKNWWRASLFIGCTVFIKLFGILFFALFLFYPKWWKGVFPAAMVTLILLLLPAPFIGLVRLYENYESYLGLLANDHGTFVKYSVMGWLQNWFGFSGNKNMVVFIGLLLQSIPILVYMLRSRNSDQQGNSTRAMFVASILIWMVIFNHMAESATFVIAVAGVLVWFFYSSLPKWWRIAFLIPVIAFTCFGPSDIYPPEIRQKIVMEWQLKVFPCIVIWVLSIAELFSHSVAVKPFPSEAS